MDATAERVLCAVRARDDGVGADDARGTVDDVRARADASSSSTPGARGVRAHAFRVTPTMEDDGKDASLFRIDTLGTKTKTKMPLAQMGGARCERSCCGRCGQARARAGRGGEGTGERVRVGDGWV